MHRVIHIIHYFNDYFQSKKELKIKHLFCEVIIKMKKKWKNIEKAVDRNNVKNK